MDYLLNGLPYFPGSTIFGTGLFADGSAAAPSIAFSADTDTGFYRDSANLLAFSAGGLAQLRFGGAGTIYGGALTNFVRLGSSGSIELAAAGTGQNITLTPSDGLVIGGITNVGGSITSGFRATNGAAALSTSAIAGFSCQIPLVSPNIFQFFTRNGLGFIGQAAVADHITLFPVAGGRVGIGTTTDSGTLLQVGTNTITGAGGMVFGTDCFLFRRGVAVLNSSATLESSNASISFNSTTSTPSAILANENTPIVSRNGTQIAFLDAGYWQTAIFKTNNTTALSLDASQNATFAGWIKPRLATTAGAPAYVKGALYFDTTLNKLRVGGATAWETITSA
jgi:hypothetical protein